MKRRIFVGSVFSGIASSASLFAARARSAKLKAGDIPTRVFGKTGEKLTIIGQAGGRFPLVDKEDAKAVVRRAYDLGMNYFDNAHTYGNGRSEEIFGEVLPAFRKHVFITTKSAKRTRQEAEAELHLSLRRLRTDHVDLWQIHAVGELEEVRKVFGPGGAIEAFEAAKKAGKCRFIGFTGHRDPDVHLAFLDAYDRYDTILMPLNVADPGYLSFEQKVLPRAQQRGLGIQGMKNFGNAKLLQNFSVRECLSYVLSLPIHCTAIGCTTIGQLEDDVRVAQQFRPYGAEQMAALRERAKGLAGPRLEDWKRNLDARAGLDAPVYAGG
jgi:aryl-alcohol dehydrogenase-like predicted oxidoreductase